MQDIVINGETVLNALTWLIEHIYILGVLLVNRVMKFFRKNEEFHNNLNLAFVEVSTICKQHERRINNLENKK